MGGHDRESHIGTGVPVGNRKNIQLIDPFFFGFKISRTCQKHPGKKCGIYGIGIQLRYPPPY